MEPDISHSALVSPYKDPRPREKAIVTAAGNRYFVCLGGRKPPISWNPYDRDQKINLHTEYFGNAFVAMENALQEGGWTVFLTWDLNNLPAYGERTVAVVLGDEWCRVPRYASEIAATFKCYGTKPELGCRPVSQPTYQNWLTLFQYLNARIRHLPGAFRRRRAIRKLERANRRIPPIYSIPLGYANQADLPLKPFFDRNNDVSFAGSVVHKPYRSWSPKQWFQTPKSFSRRRMIEALNRSAAAHPSWHFDLKITPSYRAIRSADPVEYAHRVMETRISVAPRGTSFETFRFFEALRFGCIVLTEFLPDRWFYKGAPVIQIEDWRRLDYVLEDLVTDADKMGALHEAALEWWEHVCSEAAVGNFMASKLNSLSTTLFA